MIARGFTGNRPEKYAFCGLLWGSCGKIITGFQDRCIQPDSATRPGDIVDCGIRIAEWPATVENSGRPGTIQFSLWHDTSSTRALASWFKRGSSFVACSERRKEIKQRRKRREQLTHLKSRLAKATTSEKVEIARKLRALTPGAEGLIHAWKLEEVDR
jgi:hypothetical protein